MGGGGGGTGAGIIFGTSPENMPLGAAPPPAPAYVYKPPVRHWRHHAKRSVNHPRPNTHRTAS
jgi:hypothetical protein